ncbi:MAG: amino acid adenylation domain-containing protein [Nostoc indistinguendum CM1-VF10]|nr:amino acid adenylation domain-containing protein [Nostoc indistinguendum CM1-VF10]
MIVGTACDGRVDEELKGSLGLLTKSLPIHCHLEENSQFSEMLERANEAKRAAYEWQECFAWEQILRADAKVTGSSFFPFCFDFEEQPAKFSAADISFSIYKQYACVDRFNLKLSCLQREDSLSAEFHYDSNVFSTEDIKRLAAQFQTLLESAINKPTAVLSELEILSNVERQQLLVEFNNTQTDYPQDKSLQQLFLEQVERTPKNIAVVFENQQLTYAELNDRANQLAHYLQRLGVGPEVLVAICVERSLEMVIGLLGVLKAGGAYLPLDPTYPKERLALMLSDAQTSVLLTQQRLAGGLPEHRAQIVCLDSDWEIIAQESEENPVSGVIADNLAYVIYTSGSTGKPKGVMISHRAICNHMFWMQTTFPLTEADKVLQKTPFSFDASVWEFYAPLLVGAQLLMARPGGHQDSDYLVKVIADQKVTTLQLVPSLLRILLEQGGLETCKYLKRIFCGGEALPIELQKRFFTNLDADLHNLYGPTEACIDATYWTCKSGIRQQVVPIGRPISNTQVYILDRQLQPVPIGVPGELYIGGVGLAHGYLNRPDLTEEKFIPNPFSHKEGARLYKTGDLARYLSDGNIEYLGRIDHQVKIRGFRIELGEIEAVLSQHPEVRETVVIAREDQPGNKRLVAYLVPNREEPAISELRGFLNEKLPEYMVPNAFVILDTLPLMPNGKVDRRALLAPDIGLSRKASFVAPQTPTEKVIAGIIAEVLGLKLVGIHDNFFELGGHSLLATQVISRVREAFSVELPLRRLFESPTIAQLSEPIETARRDCQSQLLPFIQPVSKDGELPLSFAQQRLWFLDQLEGQSATYNMPSALRLIGSLQVTALEQSLREIVQRHEVLRSNFSVMNGYPAQAIAPAFTVTLPVVDLQQCPKLKQSTFVRQLAIEEAQRPFDLANGPLLRVTLLRLGKEEHVLLVTMHHIVSDGWSIGIFLREFATLYEAFLKGAPSPLPALPIQYADFAHWQRQWLQGEVLKTQLNYWKQQLAGAPPLLELPTDRPRPPVQTFRGSTEPFQLNPNLTRRLLTLSQQSGATLFMILLSAFVTLLFRYSGQEDVVAGSPIVNRNRSETESIIGFFVNTLVLRTHLQGNPTFQQLLARVRQVALDAYAHQDVPFEQLVEALQPERDLSHTPLFQVMFVLQNTPMGRLELPGLTLTPLEMERSGAKFDLTMSMEETQQGLTGELEYNTDLFDAVTITRMAGHFQTLLEAIVVNPEQRVSEFPLLTVTERHQMLLEWNNTQADYPQSKCIHQLFEAQVERTPDAVAVVFEDQQLTYRELNAQANQLAHHLQALGVRPEVLVGICVERSLEMVVGLLGILKAGGAYVPLDPAYPKERLAFMLEDSQVPVLLTQDRLLETLPEHEVQVVCLNKGCETLAKESEENPISKVTADNLAYVIYTSGSTGKPKGAMNTHSGICNRLLWMQDAYQITAADHVLQKTPFSFDVSVWEFFWPLLTGARLFVARPGGHQDSAYLVKLIAKEKITTLHFVPSMLQVFLEEQGLETCDCLKHVMCSGEALPFKLQDRFFARLDAELHNLYGPTEAAVDVTFWACDRESRQHIVPIGRPIANAQIYLLDAQLQPVPVGLPGELHISGVSLARGYLNQPELTAERFIPNPFSDELGTRLYKTGDLARYRPDGTIEYLGRLDHQVKLRGFRIELDEIEAVLGEHPSVRETVVMAREDKPGDKRLVAYLVANEEPAPSISELRNFLEKKLPSYMVPAAFVLLEVLPLMSNGKVNRRVLPVPDTARSKLEGIFVAPRNSVEEALAGIWAEVLRVEMVGVEDNFFELGGDSILSLQIIARANQAGFQLTLKQIFQHQTIAELADVAGTIRTIQTQQGVVTGPVPFIQTWFFEQNFPDPHHWNVTTLLEVQPALDPTLVERVVQHILTHHDALRLRFVWEESGWRSFIVPPDEAVPFTLVDVSALPEAEQKATIEAVAAELQTSLNLAEGPLVRVALFDLGPQKQSRLLIIIHHLAADGVSLRIFLEDFYMVYQQFSQGETIALPAKTTSFKQFIERVTEYARSPELKQELDYWLALPWTKVVPLPLDYPEGRGANTKASTRTVLVSLTVEETRALLQEVPKTYNTNIRDVLLTALVQAFARWTGVSTLLVDLLGHGRETIFNDVDLSRTVGWIAFGTRVILDIGEAGNVGDALKAVKEQNSRIPNKGGGYDLLRYFSEDKEIGEKMQTLPQAEVLFNYLGQFDQVLSESSVFRLAPESTGLAHNPRCVRHLLLEVTGSVVGGRLQLGWTYSENVHRGATVEWLAQGFLDASRSIINSLSDPLKQGVYTLSDFPEAVLSQKGLE